MGVTSTFLGICTIFDEDGRRFAANFFTNLPRHAGRASQVHTDPCDQDIPISMMAHKVSPHRTMAGVLFRFAQRARNHGSATYRALLTLWHSRSISLAWGRLSVTSTVDTTDKLTLVAQSRAMARYGCAQVRGCAPAWMRVSGQASG
jgi:hypothetical protein